MFIHYLFPLSSSKRILSKEQFIHSVGLEPEQVSQEESQLSQFIVV
jgi:hypothetical protein